ncbi:50S ribosomal protein L13 [Phycisphaerales bacterium]|nr:50S ribosomal protein L13 [Phycisphaerales bacterium]RPG19781.1 MAG: 50S ribosomal protein L13 [Phycisphaera sp. TMED9]
MPRQTYHAKPGDIEASWHLFDAEGKILGRFATQIATILMGKHRPEYTPHVLSGDFVIVLNASKIVMTGNKLDDKTLRRYSGYPSGQKVETYRRILERDPTRLVKQAIIRMIPSGPLGRDMESRLKVYAGDKHPHQAQKPVVLEATC